MARGVDRRWQAIVDLNLNGTMFTCRAAWPHLVDSTGAVVVVSSLSAVMGVGETGLEQMGGFQPSASYQASKAGDPKGSRCTSPGAAASTACASTRYDRAGS